MAIQVAPTKTNLMKAKSSLEFSVKGFELLDKKRNVLIREMMEFVDKARGLQSEIYSVIEKAYAELKIANITLGVKNVQDISYSIPLNESYEVLLRSIMGVDIPTIKYDTSDTIPTYGFYNTTAGIDNARSKFNDVKYKIYELAEIENSIYKLAIEIEKTQKRANALEHVQIPKYKEQVKYISDILEEKEREDFFRLKRLKSRAK